MLILLVSFHRILAHFSLRVMICLTNNKDKGNAAAAVAVLKP